MTTDKYEALREAAKAATPGPWKNRKGFMTDTREIYRPNRKIERPLIPSDLATVQCSDTKEGQANARFIAAANPTTILALLAEREALRDALQAITDQLERVGDTRMHKDGQFIADARAALNQGGK